MGHLDEELQKNPEMDVEKVRAAVVLESMFESLGDLRFFVSFESKSYQRGWLAKRQAIPVRDPSS